MATQFKKNAQPGPLANLRLRQFGKAHVIAIFLQQLMQQGDVDALKEQIDNRPSTPQVAQLQQRSWLMHWALFLLGNHPSGKTIVADLVYQDQYLNALQTNCAHLLRYLAVAVVTNPRRRGLLKELVRTIGLERHQHSDAVTLFLEDLYVRCDFEAAQARLADCAKLLDSDFFLSNQEEEFLKHAR